MDLDAVIAQYVALADKRGLGSFNPIVLTLHVQGQDFIIVIAKEEPSHLRLPINVVWINQVPNDPNNGLALRRVSRSPADGYRDTWEPVADYQDLLSQVQTYDETFTFLVGEIDVNVPPVHDASTTEKGEFRLNLDPANPVNPIAVGNNDPRMTDARTPTAHDHLEFRIATELSLNLGQKLTVFTSGSPQAGMVLFIKPGTQEGEWRFPTALDVIEVPKVLDHLSLVGPSSIQETGIGNFVCTAFYTDGTSQVVTPVWSLDNTVAAAIDVGGTFTPLTIFTDTDVLVTATYTLNGLTKTASSSVLIFNVKQPRATNPLVIIGPATIDESSSGQYTCIVYYDDGTSNTIVPAWSVDQILGTPISIDSNGLVVVGDVNNDSPTNVRAAFSVLGQVLNASLTVTIINTLNVPQSLAITGVNSLMETATSSYTATVTYIGGLQAPVTPAWSLAVGDTAAGIASNGILTANTVAADTPVTIHASYLENGVTVSAQRTVTVVNKVVTNIVISGPSSANGYSAAQFTATAHFNDGMTQDVTMVGTWTAQLGTFTQNAGIAVLDIPAITQNQTDQIQIAFTYSGTEYTQTKVIDLVYVVTPAHIKWGYGPDSPTFTYTEQFITDLANRITLPHLAPVGGIPSYPTFDLNVPNTSLFGYLAHPVAWGLATFYDRSAADLPGAWDGATADYGGPATVMYTDPDTGVREQWYLYRTDFSPLGIHTFALNWVPWPPV